MKRVLIVENGAGFGGALSSLATLVEALPPTSWDVHLITSYPQDVITERGAVSRVTVLPRERRYGKDTEVEQRLRTLFGRRAGNAAFVVDHLTTGRAYANAVAEYIRKHQVDVVHCNNGILINDAVVRGAAKANAPCVVHSRGPEYGSKVSSVLASSVDCFMAVSDFVADTVRDIGVEDDRITVVPEGLDSEGFAERADAKAFREAIGIAPDVPLVGMVGCLVGWKGQEVFLDACVDIMKQTDAIAVVVGDSPAKNSEQMLLLRQQARSLGVRDRVIFTGHRSDVPSVMAACDVMVHASTAPEPFGRVLLEAMAVGTPVVATDAGGPAEVVTHGVDGYLVPPSDAPEMAKAVIALLKDDAMRETMGQAGFKTSLQYSMDRHVGLVTDVYKCVIAAKSLRGS